MDFFFAFLFALMGLLTLRKAVRAHRSGSIATWHWGVRRTHVREEDALGFKAVLVWQFVAGVAFLLLAGIAFLDARVGG